MLATEADVVRTLRAGTYTLRELYDLCEQQTDTGRDGGHDPVPGHAGDHRWKHRVRGALASLRRAGRADRISRTTWAIQGTPQRPSRLLLIVAGATRATSSCAWKPPPACWPARRARRPHPVRPALRAGPRPGRRFSDGNGYRRDHTRIVPGYVDVEPANYEAFTREWSDAAAAALRPGGQLAVITGPQRAAIVQCAAENAGLTWVTTIAARRNSRSRPRGAPPPPTGP